MTHEEQCEELQRLIDWQDYYEKLYIKTERKVYENKAAEYANKIESFKFKTGISEPKPKPFLSEALKNSQVQVSQAVKDKFKAMKPIDTGQLKRSIQLTRENLEGKALAHRVAKKYGFIKEALTKLYKFPDEKKRWMKKKLKE